MDRVELKKEAKEFAFQNKWNTWKPLLVLSLIEGAIVGILSACGLGPEQVSVDILSAKVTTYQMSTTGSLIASLAEVLLLPIMIGLIYYYLQLVRGKKPEIKDLFCKYKYILPIFVITLLTGLFTALWTLLLIIPGIIYAFSVTLVPYLLADEVDDKTGYMELINKSREKMKGHKMEYFILQLSFIGWYILVGITFGIASIWVVPYHTIANVKFYEKLK